MATDSPIAPESLLSDCRVLDLAGEPAMITGRVLADMGADVIKVEPPGGAPERRIGPFWKDRPDADKSLYWFSYNAGKRGITLNIESEDGRGLLRHLLAEADILIESFAPGYLGDLGLDTARLRKMCPGLVHVSVTPFGQDGPYAGYVGSDLVGMAMGGFMHTHGDEDRPPVSFSVPQVFLHAGAEGAAAAVIAWSFRQRTGRGQHVDVSAQEAAQWTLQNAAWFWDLLKVNVGRAGAVRRRPGGGEVRSVWPAKKGYIMFPGGRMYDRIARWMEDEGLLDEDMRGIDFTQIDGQHSPQEEIDLLTPSIGRFFQSMTAWAGYEGAVDRRIMMMPVSDIREVVEYQQLEEREFFIDVEHDHLGETIRYPGSFIRSTAAGPFVRGRAPLIGEHNQAVYRGEMGLSRGELQALAVSGAI